MKVPETLYYTPEHEWLRMEGDLAYIGITDFAQGELGDIVYVDVPTQGESIEAGAVFGTVEAVKTVSDLYMPLSGYVLELNPNLADQPELLNQDPYGQGWIIKVRLNNQADLEQLLSAASYREHLGA